MASLHIVADIQLLLEGLRGMLERQGEFAITGCFATTEMALEAARAKAPDLAVIDLATPGSLGFIQTLARTTDTCVIVIGLPHTDAAVIQCAEAGAAGYVCRDQSFTRLLQTMQSAGKGELTCSAHDAALLLRQVKALAASRLSEELPALTVREEQIARCFQEGLTNKEIAARLGIELSTVKNHVHKIFEKLQVHRKADAAHRLRARFSIAPDQVRVHAGR